MIPQDPERYKKGSTKKHTWDVGPADCAKRLQSACSLLARSLGVLNQQLNSCLISTPESPLGSSAQSALPLHPVDPFSFVSFTPFSGTGKSKIK